jgi:preprotein translocase subunit SecD
VPPPAGTLRVGRYFLALVAILAVLYGIVFWPGQRHTPKLGLDLEGGTQVVYQARTDNGGTPSKSSMQEARQILEQRVNAYGVAESTVVIQGNDQIVISIPGKSAGDISNIGAAAKLNFRPVVMPPVPVGTTASSPSATASGSGSTAPSGATGSASSSAVPGSSPSASAKKSGQAAGARALAAPTTTPASATPTATPAPSPSAAASPSPSAATKKSADPLAGLKFAIPQNEAAFDKLTQAQQTQLSTAMKNFDCNSKPPDDDKHPTLLACDSATSPTLVFLLGPVIVPGTEISSATAQAPNGTSLQWAVSLSLKTSGQKAWADYTTAHNTGGVDSSTPITSCGASTTPCANFVAFTLDGVVVSSPYNKQAINGVDTQISGSFDQKSATDLANQLKYGALPLSFNLLTTDSVTATLGAGQLKAGMLAGGIGLALVVVYSLLYYRALGFVTIASLLVSGVLTYASLVVLGNQIGFTLTLAGIAGFIVAVGITADSFVVFFERIKDEVHDGRSVRVAVPRAWVRARRTILSADTVSFLAAAILYYFAAGDVRGFAFALGLSTILDLVVVFLFTHPLVSLLSRSRAFGSARFTGLDSARAGGIVRDETPTSDRPRSRPGRRTRDAAAGPGGTSAVEPAPTGGGVAVLDAERNDAGAVEEAETAAEPADELDQTVPASTAPPANGATPVPTPEPADDGGPPPSETAGNDQPRSTPQPGSAAERAAARRAKIRAERGQG